jgi:hypothetical protein
LGSLESEIELFRAAQGEVAGDGEKGEECGQASETGEKQKALHD